MNAVIIATYNEFHNVPKLIREIKDVLPDCLVLVVDDNSPDGTAKAVRELGIPGVKVMVRTKSRGYGTAIRDGLLKACELGANRIATIDADFSHNPKELPMMFEGLNHADVMIGSRYCGGVRVMNWQMKRLFLSSFANLYVRKILGLPAEDCTSGYRAYRRSVLKKMKLKSIRTNGYAFLVEMLWRAMKRDARVHEHPIVYVERREGESKMSKLIILESAWLPLRLLFSGDF